MNFICGKETFSTLSQAQLRASGMSTSGKHKIGFSAYHCRECNKFHIHSKRGKHPHSIQDVGIKSQQLNIKTPSAPGNVTTKDTIVFTLTERINIPEHILNKLKQIK